MNHHFLLLRLDKFVVIHFRDIRGSMRIAKSFTKINEFQSLDLNEGDDNGNKIRIRRINIIITPKLNHAITNIITGDSKDAQINLNALKKIENSSESKMINNIKNKSNKYNDLGTIRIS